MSRTEFNRGYKLLLIPFVFVTIACSTSAQNAVKGFYQYKVKNISYIEPCVNVSSMAEKNIATYSDSLSKISHDLADSILTARKLPYQLSGEIFINGNISDSMKWNIVKLAHQFAYSRKRDTIKIEPIVQQLIQKSENDYVAMIVIDGYSRTKTNYAHKMEKSVAVGVLSLGMYVPLYSKGGAIVYMLLADKRTNQIVYYDKIIQNNSDPMKKKDMGGILNSIISDFR